MLISACGDNKDTKECSRFGFDDINISKLRWHGGGSTTHFNLLCTSIHPEEQLADGVKGEGLHVLKAPPDDDLLARASIKTQPLWSRTRQWLN